MTGGCGAASTVEVLEDGECSLEQNFPSARCVVVEEEKQASCCCVSHQMDLEPRPLWSLARNDLCGRLTENASGRRLVESLNARGRGVRREWNVGAARGIRRDVDADRLRKNKDLCATCSFSAPHCKSIELASLNNVVRHCSTRFGRLQALIKSAKIRISDLFGITRAHVTLPCRSHPVFAPSSSCRRGSSSALRWMELVARRGIRSSIPKPSRNIKHYWRRSHPRLLSHTQKEKGEETWRGA
uniref:Uncharacterized protein n=1 Tax=Mycena chlorophos TaxID=658473 RepID=A0ABQ0L766_MYCCL|nr:predicted protein [Mycena chlorophos]